MIYNLFSEILSFYLIRNISLVISINNNNNNQLKEEENIKVRYFLSNFNISLEDKNIIYGCNDLCNLILLEQKNNISMMDYIGQGILNLQLKNKQSIFDFLKTLPDASPIKNRIILLLSEDNNECAICFESNPTDLIRCTHILCNICSKKVKVCPLCRKSFTINDIFTIEKKCFSDKEDERKEIKIEESSLPKKNISIILEKDFGLFCKDRIKNMFLKKRGVLTSIEMEEIFLLIKYFLKECIELFQNITIVSEEIRCFVVAIVYKIHSNILLVKYINSPNRILRFLAVLYMDNNDKKYGIPHPKEKILLKGNRSFRSIILEMISLCSECEKIEEEFRRNEKKWKAIFKFIHFGEIKNRKKYPIAFNYGNRICNAKKYEKNVNIEKLPKNFVLYESKNIGSMCTITGKINQFIDLKDEKIFDYLIDKPGLTFRYMRRICFIFETSERLLPFLNKIIPKMNFDQQVDLYHIFSSPDQKHHPDIVITSKSTIYWKKKKI